MQITRTFATPLLLSLALAACGGDDAAGPEEPAAPDPVVDAQLAGEWLGSIQGAGSGMSAAADVRFELDADGRMRVSPSNPPFHPIPSGNWGVADSTFLATGTDTEGATVEFEAPRSTTLLRGTWVSAFGAGTFSVTKQ